MPFLEKGVSFAPKTVYGLFQSLPFVSEGERINKLKSENLELISKLVELEKLRKENTALLSQFQTQDGRVDNLLPVRIVGAPGFIPSVTQPLELILDKGERDNVAVGQGVVFKNNLIGKVSKTSYNLSKVEVVTNPLASFPAKTIGNSVGIVRGEGEGKMTLSNVLPSENLKIGDLVLTKGDIDINGIGIPPDLIVGRIQSIEKIPTAIFQKAEVKSLVDFSKLSTVFIVGESN